MMSTFDGIVQEFPFITIDYFRKNPKRPPPLACFLSHAHSDHLQGLESFRAPFVYCSAATKELLLRIEKYPHRMDFNNGILESRRLHYKHLSKLLRPIPLNTPTDIELTPRLFIRVTLLDANHCTGAVMFLIEGDGKAILYTGDIRSEIWWVNGLIRHPILIPYTLGTRRLDKIYLDTTFAHTSHALHTFPTKAEGIAELLRKLEPYPEDTIFYFRAWTFGYEEVWMALAAALRTKVHVDRYQIGLYRSVSSSREGSGALEVPSLCGFELGNRFVPGCLSEDEKARIHSCEPGVHCSAASSKKTVYITPIVSRITKGSDIPEIGAGGGLGDLYQIHELELPDQPSLARLEQLCSEKIHDPQALSTAKEALSKAFRSKSKTLSLDGYGMKDAHEMPLEELVNVLSRGRLSEESLLPENQSTSAEVMDESGRPLPRTIRFPYSRHSSYAELCGLVAAFNPRDIHPCTVDPLDWDEDVSMQRLFGHLCSDNKFVHDHHMREITATENSERPRKRARREPEMSTQSTQHSTLVTDNDSDSRTFQSITHITTEANIAPPSDHHTHTAAPEPSISRPTISVSSPLQSSRRKQTPLLHPPEPLEQATNTPNNDSLDIPSPSPRAAKARRNAIRQAWHLLDAQESQHNQFLLESLPSSWPTNEESSQIDGPVAEPQEALEEIAEQKFSQVTAIHDPSTQNSQSTRTVQGQKSTSPRAEGFNKTNSATDIIMETDLDSTSDTDTETKHTHTSHQTNPYQLQPSSQQSHTHTISSSAFISQSQDQIQLQDEPGVIDEEEYLSEQEPPETNGGQTSTLKSNSDSETPTHSRRLLRQESSIRKRREAYLAAREDSYDAWTAMSLVSAGNNHTEEEVEL
ncbi:hypothetical protein BDV12DRAFT_168343 [Aspergillus spectabilis]